MTRSRAVTCDFVVMADYCGAAPVRAPFVGDGCHRRPRRADLLDSSLERAAENSCRARCCDATARRSLSSSCSAANLGITHSLAGHPCRCFSVSPDLFSGKIFQLVKTYFYTRLRAGFSSPVPAANTFTSFTRRAGKRHVIIVSSATQSTVVILSSSPPAV